MISKKQAKLAQAITGSGLNAKALTEQMNSLSPEIKRRIFYDLKAVTYEYDLPFDEAFPIVSRSCISISKREGIDAGTVFCVFMDQMIDR